MKVFSPFTALLCLVATTPTAFAAVPRLPPASSLRPLQKISRCKPSTVMGSEVRNGGFDQVSIPARGSIAQMAPWYFDRLKNIVGDFRKEEPDKYYGGGVAAFHITGSRESYGYLNSPITYCAGANYTMHLAARVLPRGSGTNHNRRLRVVALHDSSFIAEIAGGAFRPEFQLFGPYQFTIHRDHVRQNTDGTWDDTLSLIVQCSGIAGKPATDVLFEIDSVYIIPVRVRTILPSTPDY